jgi:hypothetical protein
MSRRNSDTHSEWKSCSNLSPACFIKPLGGCYTLYTHLSALCYLTSHLLPPLYHFPVRLLWVVVFCHQIDVIRLSEKLWIKFDNATYRLKRLFRKVGVHKYGLSLQLIVLKCVCCCDWKLLAKDVAVKAFSIASFEADMHAVSC